MKTNKLIHVHNSWDHILKEEFQKPYFQELHSFLINEYNNRGITIFPPEHFVFNAFQRTHFSDIKVVILGQDPYHNFGQAHGLSFSVPDGVPFPKSLINIFKELQSDLNIALPLTGNLTRWAEQGVLLINATLTVRAHEPGSHQNRGWETFTDFVIQKISQEQENVVFLLWGNYAKAKSKLINGQKHCILEAAHPSPLSAYRGFFGCRHFSKTNEYLVKTGQKPIEW